MLTPIELQNKSFKTGFGYDKKDVDNFLKEVYNNYEATYKENVELTDKINMLNEGIQYYKTLEKTIQKALVLAEHTAEETKEAARKQAKNIEDEARAKASIIIEDAKQQMNDLHQKTIRLMEQYENYKLQFKHLAASQIELIESDSFQFQVANIDAIIKVDDLNSVTKNQKEESMQKRELEKIAEDKKMMQEEPKEDKTTNQMANLQDDFDIDDIKLDLKVDAVE